MSSIYTKTTAKKLIPFATKIEAVREFRNCIQVSYRVRGGRCSTFLSKLAFLDNFTALRTQNAALVEVREVHENEYVVYSQKSNTYYTVRPNHSEPNKRCECADCFHRGAKCKHQIRVEQFLSESLKVA
jgi:hypothetical protein